MARVIDTRQRDTTRPIRSIIAWLVVLVGSQAISQNPLSSNGCPAIIQASKPAILKQSARLRDRNVTTGLGP